MPVDYYIGKSVSELTDLLKYVQDRQAKGNIVEVMAAGVRSRKDFKEGQDAAEEILRIRYSLYRRAAAELATATASGNDDAISAATMQANTWTNPYAERVRSVRTRYRFS